VVYCELVAVDRMIQTDAKEDSNGGDAMGCALSSELAGIQGGL
jgi:hypothetical protein